VVVNRGAGTWKADHVGVRKPGEGQKRGTRNRIVDYARGVHGSNQKQRKKGVNGGKTEMCGEKKKRRV